jgi:hypothetical protein
VVERGRRLPRRPAPLALRIAVFGLAGLMLASTGGLVVAHLRPGLIATPSRSLASGTAGNHPAKVKSPSSTSSPTTTSPPVLAGASAGAPVLSSLEPAAGTAGEQVTVVGRALFSADGTIIATFDGAAVPTRCPSEQRCIITVPPPPRGATSVVVKLRTPSGTSNPVTFRYS